MAQPGNFTPILLYGSSTPTNVPLAANLTNNSTGSEIAINVADKNLFFKDSGGVVNTVPIRQSSTSSNGWLSSTDWNTFNGKAPATSGTSLLYGNGTGGFSNVTIGSGITFAGGTLSATGTGGTVTSVAALTLGTTGTDLSSTVANGTTTPVITLNVPTASATNRGALSAVDWATFNGKQAALASGSNIKTVGGVSLLGSGDVGTIGTGYGGTGLTSFTSGGVLYASSTSALATSANLNFNGSQLGIGGANPGYHLYVTGSNPQARIVDSSGTYYVAILANNTFAYSGIDYKTVFTIGDAGAERARFDSSGNFLVGTSSGSANTIQNAVQSQGNINLSLTNGGNFYVCSGGTGNVAATGLRIPFNNTTSRSINAGGTINASGADYAEYMVKANDFTIAKGDICGVNSEGKLTNVFSEAISFVVKSTNPSYVGGDTWASEEILGIQEPQKPIRKEARLDSEGKMFGSLEALDVYEARLAKYEAELQHFNDQVELARQTVDRIAFSGQVPVNVIGAIPGQYIVPVEVNGAIKGQAISNPTFQQYELSVGKVIAIESDGRAKIIVKAI